MNSWLKMRLTFDHQALMTSSFVLCQAKFEDIPLRVLMGPEISLDEADSNLENIMSSSLTVAAMEANNYGT